MPRKKRTRRRRTPAKTNQAPPKRRLPLVPPQKEPLLPAQPPSPTEAENPYVTQIVEHIQRVSAISTLPVFTLLEDWSGMLEAALQLYADNARSYATTGHFIDDPPEVKETYRRARERYLKATEKYPATYREMQVAFSQTLALLIAAAGPELDWYAGQTAFSPDIIGQIYLSCLELGPPFWPYFPPWPAALEVARTAIPDGEELAYQVLLEAHLKYRQARPTDYIRPEPGESFEEWFSQILPYCEPLIIGPALLDSSVMMLAAAAQFPPWVLKNGLVLLYPDSGQPQLNRLARINGMLYRLNGYELELIRAVQDIAAHLEQRPSALEPHPGFQGPPVEPTGPPPPAGAEPVRSTGRLKPDAQTFEQLFRKIGR